MRKQRDACIKYKKQKEMLGDWMRLKQGEASEEDLRLFARGIGIRGDAQLGAMLREMIQETREERLRVQSDTMRILLLDSGAPQHTRILM